MIAARSRIPDLVPLCQLPKYLPKRAGKKIHVSAVYRWARVGIGGVRLHTVNVGGVAYTAVPWVSAFLGAQAQ